MIVFRASSLGNLMGSAKSIDESLLTDGVKAIQAKPKAKRTAEENKLLDDLLEQTLPQGAVTFLDKMVSQKLLNWHDDFDFNTLEKGRVCEEESIELYNDLNDEFYIKNVERITKGNLTGECDIIDRSKSLVIDIKTAYSKKTYPLNLKLSSLYEWQLRAYMYLYEVDNAELAYCLVDTPQELINKRDLLEWHIMDDVPRHLRVRTLRIERDEAKELQMLNRIALAHRYVTEQLDAY